MDEPKLKAVIANNIIKFRKHADMTQLQLAEKLNYSDKAVSKWERGEALPDIHVLKQMADLFKIRVDDLLREGNSKKLYIGISVEKRIIFPLMAVIIVFLIATIIFAFLIMLAPNLQNLWMCFIFAIPAASLSFLIFHLIWKKYALITIFGSIFIWTLALSLFLITTVRYNFIIFIIAVPVQILIILWYILVKISISRKNKL